MAKDKGLFLIVYSCVVHSFKKEDFLENLRILSRPVELESVLFNLLCVFGRVSSIKSTPTGNTSRSRRDPL